MSLAFLYPDMKKEILQTMKILPIESICPFEWNSNRDDSIEIDDIHQIRHPFLVSPLKNGKYLLLEETAEFYTLLQAGIPLVPVQIVQPDQICMHQKTIGLYAFNENDLGEILSTESQTISCQHADANTDESGFVKLYVGERKYLLQSKTSNETGCSNVITKLFEFFEQNGGYRMMKQHGSLSDSLMKIHRFDASVELPEITFEQIQSAGLNKEQFPPSILQTSSEVRVLYIDFPVSTLISDNSIIEKEVFLKELILLREQAEKTSIYEGRVYLLNR